MRNCVSCDNLFSRSSLFFYTRSWRNRDPFIAYLLSLVSSTISYMILLNIGESITRAKMWRLYRDTAGRDKRHPSPFHYINQENIIDVPNRNRFSRQTFFGWCFVFGALNDLFLLTSCTSHTWSLCPLDFLDLLRDRIDVFLRSTSLERRLSSLEVTSVVLGPYEGKDDDIRGHASDENTLDKSVIWYIFWAVWSLDRRAEVFTASYGTRETDENNPVVEGEIPTGFDLGRS